jgi:hypothetical protein
MDKLGSIINNFGTLLRDIFLYLVPAIPFILFTIPFLENIGIINIASLTSKVQLLNRPILAEATIVVLIYVVGRILNALSYPLFWFFKSTIGKLQLKWITDFNESKEAVNEIDENQVFAKILKIDKDIYNYLIERNIIISMSEQSLSTASFCVGLVIIFSQIYGSTLIPWCYSLFYGGVAFFLSILFVFMNISTMTEYYSAIKSLNGMHL